MALSLEEVIREIDREEPDYVEAARMGAEALPFLRELIQGNNTGLSAKATYLAGVINRDESAGILTSAARHPEPIVRVAAAASAQHLDRVSSTLASTLLEDPDPGVRKWILKTLETHSPEGVRDKVEKIMRDDPIPALRDHAKIVIQRLP